MVVGPISNLRDDALKDDTLNHIRKEYLESKKQISNLLSQETNTNEFSRKPYPNSSPIRKFDHFANERPTTIDAKLREQLRTGASDVAIEQSLRTNSDESRNQMIYDDMKVMKRIIDGQQESIRELRRALEQERYMNSELQRKYNEMERRFDRLEWFINSHDKFQAYQDIRSNTTKKDFSDPIFNNGLKRRWDEYPIRSFEPDTNINRNNRILSNYDDSTTRLMQITDPHYRSVG
ncbi:Spindle Pole Component 29 [Nakaseomyces glabratus]